MPENTPRNRQATKLGMLRIEVEHAGGVETLDPNREIMAILQRPDEVTSWGPVPGRTSVLSGEPAILYRADDLEVPLTVPEYVRLVGRELRPEEFRALLREYGDAFEWHDDFYDPETGEACQPKGLASRLGFGQADQGHRPRT
jgi:hypothetical protein